MEWLPRAEMRLEDSSAPIVIIDTSLALSPFGLLITLRLAGAGAEVWLTPSLWRRLDEASLEGWHPMAETKKDDKAATEQRAVIAQWERARLDLASKRLFWVAETPDESSLPKGVDAGVVARFDALKASLAAVCGPDDDMVDNGDIDSLVLSAALAERPTAVFALMGKGEAPHLADLAAAIGAKCRRLATTAAKPPMQLWWQPLLLRAGLLDFFSTDTLKLACLRLIAPGAFFFDMEPDDDAATSSKDWLGGAHVMWSAM